jgi:hypothetical protein
LCVLKLFVERLGTSQPREELFIVTLAWCRRFGKGESEMGGIIYIVGLVVVILAVLSLFGLR